MKSWLLVIVMIPAFAACVSRSYERDTVVERPNTPSTVVVPQGSTVPPPRDTTVIVPR